MKARFIEEDMMIIVILLQHLRGLGSAFGGDA